MRNLEQLRQRVAEKERQRRILYPEHSPEYYQILREQEEAKRKRKQEEMTKANDHLAYSGAWRLAHDFQQLSYEADNIRVELAAGEVALDEKYEKYKSENIQTYSALKFPYTPGKTSSSISVYWDADFFGKFKGKKGFIVEALHTGIIKAIGSHTILLQQSEWEENPTAIEAAFNHAIQNPVRLRRVKYDIRVYDTYIEGPGA